MKSPSLYGRNHWTISDKTAYKIIIVSEVFKKSFDLFNKKDKVKNRKKCIALSGKFINDPPLGREKRA